jgi:hypothetical protein
MVGFFLTITVIILAVIVLFWLKKSLFIFGFFFKILTLAFIIFTVGTVVFGYLVIQDTKDFKNNFANSTNMFLVTDSLNTTESFLAGAILNPKDKEFKTIDAEMLASIEKDFNEGNIRTLNSEYYKIFVIDIESFDEVELYNIMDQNVELTREEMKSIMLSEDAREELSRIMAEKNGQTTEEVMDNLAATSEEIKGYLLSYYLTAVFNPSNVVQFLIQLKSGNIRVYKETALFKAVKLIPSSLIGILVKF